MLYNYSNTTSVPIISNIAITSTSFIGDPVLSLKAPNSDFVMVFERGTYPNITQAEVVLCTSRTGNVFTITRAYEPIENTTGASTNSQLAYEWGVGDIATIRPTAKQLNDIKSEISTLETEKLSITDYNANREVYATTSVGTDAYAITSSAISSLSDGRTIKVKADVGNTGSATLKVNLLTPYPIKKTSGGVFVDLETGDIISDMIFFVTFNSSSGGFFQFSVDPATIAIPSTEALKSNFVFGENMNTGDLYVVGDGAYDLSSYPGSTPTSLHYVGYDTFYRFLGQSFVLTESKNITKVTIFLQKVGSPTGNLSLKIYSGTGTGLIATSSTVISESTLTTSSLPYSFIFDTPLSAGTYYILIETTRASSTSNYVFVPSRSNLSGFTTYSISNTSVWSVLTNNSILAMSIQSVKNASKIYKYSQRKNVVPDGIVLDTTTAGNSGKCSVGSGVISGLSGLTVGANYYASTTGTLTTTVNQYFVGRAISATKIFFNTDFLSATFGTISLYGVGLEFYLLSSAERTTSNVANTLLKSAKINKNGQYFISIASRVSSGTGAFSFFINGEISGTETTISNTTNQTFSKTLFLNISDVVEIFARGVGGSVIYVSDFKIQSVLDYHPTIILD